MKGFNIMRIYRLDPAGFAPTRRALIIAAVMVMVIGLVISFPNRSEELLWQLYLTIGGFIVLIIGFSFWVVLRRYQQAWQTWELLIDDQQLIKRQRHFREQIVRREQITRLQETRGGIVIQAGSRLNLLVIPRAAYGYDEIKQALSQWHTIESVSPKQLGIHITGAVLYAIIAVIAFIALYASDDLRIALPAGLIALGVMIAGLYVSRKNTLSDSTTRNMWWIGLIPTFSVVMRILELLR